MEPVPLRVSIRSYCWHCPGRGYARWRGEGHDRGKPHTDRTRWEWRITWPDGQTVKTQGSFATHARALASAQRAYPKLVNRIRGICP